MLDINYRTQNLELTDWLQSYVEKKIGKMDRYLPILSDARVELRHEQVRNTDQSMVAEVTLWGKGDRVIIRGEERAGDITAAIDAVVDVLYRQIVRYKGKAFARTRQSRAEAEEQAQERAEAWVEEVAGSELPPLSPEAISELEEEEPHSVVRVKRFTLYPMDEQEAIEQMEMLGHTFFVFYNANSGRINVVYRRLDGNYGLLDPELA